jgi:hypothetical protein
MCNEPVNPPSQFSARIWQWSAGALLIAALAAGLIWRDRPRDAVARDAMSVPIPLEPTSVLTPVHQPVAARAIDRPRPGTSGDDAGSMPTRTSGALERNAAPVASTLHPAEPEAHDLGPAVETLPAPATAPLASVPLVPPSPAANVVAAAVVRPPDMDAVMHTLKQYAEALSQMDVSGAERIWPTVDQRALSGAFKTLEKNEMVLNACAIDVGGGSTAFVTCHARVEFVPKVGNRSPQVSLQQWRFTMNKIADQWTIKTASAVADR